MKTPVTTSFAWLLNQATSRFNIQTMYAAARCFFVGLALMYSIQAFAQTTATEDFENETAANTGVVFSESGINFTTTFPLRDLPSAFPNGSYGYAASAKYLEIARVGMVQTTTATISLNTVLNPGIGFRINSFAAYTAANNGGTIPNNGILTVSGTPLGGGALVTVNIPVGSESGTLPSGQTREANGMVNGLTLGSAFNGLFFTSLTFTIFDNDLGSLAGTSYLGLDHINFTTQAPVTNNYTVGNVSYTEGNSGSAVYAYTVNRSINTAAGSVQIQSSNGTATSGSDYVAVPLTTVNFTAGGALSQTVNVTINGDATIEPNETFNMTLSNPSGGTISTATGVVTITDDDLFAEVFDDETANAAAFSQNGANFTIAGKLRVRNGGTFGANGSSGFAAPLEPYTTGNQGAFTIEAGKSFYVVSVDLWAATVTGSSPSFTFTATNCSITMTGTKADGSGFITHTAAITPTGVNGHSTVSFAGTPFENVALTTIGFSTPTGITYLQVDNFKYGVNALANTQVSISDVSVLEGTTGAGTSPMVFTVTRTNNTTAFTVNVASSNGTATAGVDYTAVNTTLSFTNGGALSQTVTVQVTKDATVEAGETINMTLSGATNGTLLLKSVGIGTILNDDGPLGETFEDEVTNATTFSEGAGSFSATGGYRVRNSGTFGSGSSNFYLTSPNNVVGSMGTITITTGNTAFKLTSLDAWVGTSTAAFSSGTVTFTGTLLSGGTVSTNKTITATNNTGTGWQQGITFTGTPLDNVLLTALQVTTTGALQACDLDNINYTLFSTLPVIELRDAGNNLITNNSAASTTNNTDFGSTTCSTGGTVTKVFTIKNTGFSNLTLSGSPLAVLGGTDAAQFSVTTQPTTPIAASSSVTVTVRYNPNVAGTHNATLTLTNNDATNSPYVINIKGASTSTAGDPSVFGTNIWRVYAWNAGGATINANSWNTNYSGFYTSSSLNINTNNDWNKTTSPSSATGYVGCIVANDNHSWSAKRQGFPCGMYQLDVPYFDDAVQLFVNGTKVYENATSGGPFTNVWTGFLGTTDQVEFRVTEGSGGSEGQLTFTLLSLPAATTNNALNFDGVNDYVEIKNCSGAALDVLNAITIEYWFKGSNLQSAVRLQNGSGYIVAGWSTGLHIISSDGGTTGGLSVGANAMNGNWHHVAMTWQRNTANGFKSYLDGQLVAQRNSLDVPLPSINSGMYLGAFNGSSEFMNGTLDEVRVWNVARTQAEIQANMMGCTALGATPNLVMYYQFNNGSADAANTVNTMPNSANATTYIAALNNFGLTAGSSSNWTSSPLCTDTYTWTGAISTDFANLSNWSPAVVPSSTSSIVIPATTNGLMLAANRTINQLTFTGNAKIKLDGFNLTVNNLNGGGPNAYVVTSGTSGPNPTLTIKNVGTTATLFPVGPSETVYAPAIVTNNVARDFAVKVGTTLTNPAVLTKTVNLQWDITPSVLTGNSATLALGWLAASQGSAFNIASPIEVAHYNGTAWDVFRLATLTGLGTNASPYVATVSGVNAFSPFVVANQNALPIELLDFKGTPQYNGNFLTWTTASEVNNKGFYVETQTSSRLQTSTTLTANEWVTLGFVKSTSSRLQTSTTLNTYDFTDTQTQTQTQTSSRLQTSTTLNTIAYYRLRQIDNDGKETLSKVISISTKGNNKLKVYPNPVSNVLTVERNAVPFTNDDFQILNLLGQQVMNHAAVPTSSKFQTSPTLIDVSALPQGTYFLKVGTEQVKFVKQ